MKYLPLLFLLPVFSQASIINWVIVDYPPYYIISGDNKGQGRDEAIMRLVTAKVDRPFTIQLLPASRAVKSMDRNDEEVHCLVSLFKTRERKKFLHFTENFSTIGLSPSIAARKSILKQLATYSTKSVYLADMLHKYHLSLGVTLNRSYGQKIDDIIAHISSDKINKRAGQNALESLTYMLLKGRVDLILGYPSEHYYIKNTLDKDNQLIQLKINETNQISFGHIGCSKNNAGERLINDMDQALAELKSTEQYKTIMLRWLPETFKDKLTPHLTFNESYIP
ncbi:TIGR02285 family protein [Catenovulum sp. SM1970]|uniref:TIGR02285 family protein n=1 Tax=Marinifaba aquimaris TaxID=2741323 RepID=UPI0015726002|nr:TIGR02285 family protein [Marinifaba aquimaris]NTS77298.1 TIGR02285 family protein [Marinifaba aquimaris]